MSESEGLVRQLAPDERLALQRNRGKLVRYLVVSFAWTWLMWLSSWVLSRAAGTPLATDVTLLTVLREWATGAVSVPQLLFALAVYGPLIGFLAVGARGSLWGKTPRDIVGLVVAVPLLSLLPAVAASQLAGVGRSALPFGFVLLAACAYFVSNLLTSGTEEFGWRGVLYPALKALPDGRGAKRSFWNVALVSGLIWAAWHLPLMAMLYLPHGFVALPTLIGFTASIVAMSYITNFIYERSGAIALAMLLHALNNTASAVLVMLYPGTPFTIVPAVLAWVAVGYIERRYRVDSPAAGRSSGAGG